MFAVLDADELNDDELKRLEIDGSDDIPLMADKLDACELPDRLDDSSPVGMHPVNSNVVDRIIVKIKSFFFMISVPPLLCSVNASLIRKLINNYCACHKRMKGLNKITWSSFSCFTSLSYKIVMHFKK